MEQTTKTTKVETNVESKANGEALKKIVELSDIEIRKLPIADFSMIRTVSKKTGTEHFSISFKLFQGLTVNLYIDEANFEIISHKYGFTGGFSRYSGKCHYRLSCGIRPDGSIFYFVEILIARSLIKRAFLTDAQATQIEVCGLVQAGLKVFDRGSDMDGVVADQPITVID